MQLISDTFKCLSSKNSTFTMHFSNSSRTIKVRGATLSLIGQKIFFNLLWCNFLWLVKHITTFLKNNLQESLGKWTIYLSLKTQGLFFYSCTFPTISLLEMWIKLCYSWRFLSLIGIFYTAYIVRISSWFIVFIVLRNGSAHQLRIILVMEVPKRYDNNRKVDIKVCFRTQFLITKRHLQK